MKVLFINHPEGDMLEAVAYLGLCRLYGADDVVDWPRKASYHGETARYPSVYGPEHGEGVTGPFAWFPAQGGRAWSDDEVRDRAREFDVVVASIRDHAVAALSLLVARVGRGALRRLVLLDGQDSDAIRWDLAVRFRPDVYAKRELLARLPADVVRVVPCPFASPLDESAEVAKDIDLADLGAGNFFSGVVARGAATFRGASTKAEVDAALCREFLGRVVVVGHVGYDEFLRATARTRVAACLGGFGWDTFRQWEVPSFRGTLLLRNRSPQIIQYDFVDGESCAEFSWSLAEMVAVARAYLDDDARRERVARAGNALLREHHTCEARARQLVEEALR